MKKTPIVLEIAEVAAKYTTDWPTDPEVHVCGIYKGKLSKIPLDAADASFKMGCNWLALKQATKPNNKQVKPDDTPKEEPIQQP